MAGREAGYECGKKMMTAQRCMIDTPTLKERDEDSRSTGPMYTNVQDYEMLLNAEICHFSMNPYGHKLRNAEVSGFMRKLGQHILLGHYQPLKVEL